MSCSQSLKTRTMSGSLQVHCGALERPCAWPDSPPPTPPTHTSCCYQSGNLTRLADLLWSIARCNTDEGDSDHSDALLSRFYVRRRSEGDERQRPDIRSELNRHPAWERVTKSGIATPPRGSPKPMNESDGGRGALSPLLPRRRSRVPFADAGGAGAAAAGPAVPPLVDRAGPWMAPPPAKRRFGGRVQGAATRSLRMVRAVDFAGLTALHHAARLNRADMVKLLLEFGADPKVRCYRRRNMSVLIAIESCVSAAARCGWCARHR
jgi:hypothetical protein